ncbi:hypothetical protein [Pseudoalteromonas tunicata]|jgi:hypothetical protein|uniref:Uncharacterized protein n=1 Tax=Pseudoalteromonas tunicata D2 TaxID=87626 RepID=A4CCY3_9GAMM|nr:hypothetical protein [Pseudoalteromonas tunicata]ATC93933.1 hypothetical protein PTUN_a1282 [Pseudoalteromonas tunicata]EAR27426.1 hypothetical protein PTD2_15342 [Pseudoalteromonas tunicata D2]
MTTQIEILTQGNAAEVLAAIADKFNDLSEPMGAVAAVKTGHS